MMDNDGTLSDTLFVSLYFIISRQEKVAEKFKSYGHLSFIEWE